MGLKVREELEENVASPIDVTIQNDASGVIGFSHPKTRNWMLIQVPLQQSLGVLSRILGRVPSGQNLREMVL
jgi:hypothetical protein